MILIDRAQRQSLSAFTDCFPVYGKAVCEEYAKMLWEAFVLEVRRLRSAIDTVQSCAQIYNATNAEFEALSLAALRSLLTTLYPEPSKDAIEEDEVTEKETGGIVVDICAHGLSELQEADKSNAKAATKVLALMVTVSSALSESS